MTCCQGSLHMAVQSALPPPDASGTYLMVPSHEKGLWGLLWSIGQGPQEFFVHSNILLLTSENCCDERLPFAF